MAALKSTVNVIIKADITLDMASIPANTTADQTITVNGALPGYPTSVWCEALESGLVIGHAWASALNTVKFRVGNVTTGAIDAASHTYRVVQR